MQEGNRKEYVPEKKRKPPEEREEREERPPIFQGKTGAGARLSEILPDDEGGFFSFTTAVGTLIAAVILYFVGSYANSMEENELDFFFSMIAIYSGLMAVALIITAVVAFIGTILKELRS